MSQPQRVALVTGSTSGIGAAIARRLSEDGFAVVLHSRSSVDVGISMARELGLATYVQADLADDADRVRLVQEAVAQWGRLDVVVNNAGISRVVPHTNMAAATPDMWRELHEVNVIAPFRIIAEAEAALRASAAAGQPACVINVSSHAGVRPKGAYPLFRDESCAESRHALASDLTCSRYSCECRGSWACGYSFDC